LLRLALAEQALGASTLEGHIADLRERFAANRQRGDTSHQREEARFALYLLKDPKEALRLIPAVRPDLAIVDLSLGEENGLDFIKDLRVRHPELPVLVLSMHDESFYAERALRSGARGYIMKREPVSVLRAAATQVLAGDIYLSPQL